MRASAVTERERKESWNVGRLFLGRPGGSVCWASAFSSGHDLGILRWSPTSDSLHRGEPASPSAPLPAHALSLSQVKKKKILKECFLWVFWFLVLSYVRQATYSPVLGFHKIFRYAL